MGAGKAGVKIAVHIRDAMIRVGQSTEQASVRFWLVAVDCLSIDGKPASSPANE